jgi:hypothetical protein
MLCVILAGVPAAVHQPARAKENGGAEAPPFQLLFPAA